MTTPQTFDRLSAVMAHRLVSPEERASFLDKIHRLTGWSESELQAVLIEYRRFAFLATEPEPEPEPEPDAEPDAEPGRRLAPSPAVDIVWHIHLQFTSAYWGDFCGTLGRPLHHYPVGASDDANGWERQTMEAYRRHFGEPPADIWSPTPPILRPLEMGGRGVVDTTAVSVMTWVYVAGIGGAAPYLLAFQLPGPGFLAAYGLLLVIAILVGLRNRDEIATRVVSSPPSNVMSAETIGYLFRGSVGARQVAAARMVSDGHLIVTPPTRRRWFSKNTTHVAIGHDPAWSEHKLSELRSWAGWSGVDECAATRLRELGLLPTVSWGPRLLTIVPAASVATLGLLRLRLGISRGRPVGLLIFSLFVTGILVIVLLSRVQTMGEKLAKSLLRAQTAKAAADGEPEQFLRSIAVYGQTASPSSSPQFLAMMTVVPSTIWAAGGDGGGCGGGGGGCGGGGCGGGCGG